jgi:hypothetical protein
MPLQSDKPFGGMAQQGVVDAVHKCTLLLCNICIVAFEKTSARDECIKMRHYRCLTCPVGLLLTVSILTLMERIPWALSRIELLNDNITLLLSSY